MESKRGMTTFMLIFMIILCISMLVILSIIAYALGLVDDQFSGIDFPIGNQSFNDTYQDLMHPGVEAMSTTAPQIISIGTFLGMILVIMIVGVKTEKKSNIWILLDICIIIVAEIFAVAVKGAFQNQILNLTPEFYQIFTTTLSQGSKFVLNLPTIIPTAGIVAILATYVLKREAKEESIEESGFYQIEDEY